MMIMIFFTMLIGLTGCESIKNDNTKEEIQTKIVEAEGTKTIEYKVLLTNSTIYDFKDIKFTLELYVNDELSKVALNYNDASIVINHGKTLIVEGKLDYVEGFELRIKDYSFTPLSFMDTYRAFVILMPIIAVVISGIVVYALLKNDSNKKADSGRASIGGLFGLVAMAGMVMVVGWVPILFMFATAAVIFLSGVVAVYIKKHRYIPKEVLEQMERERIASEQAKNALVIDAEVVDVENSENGVAEEANATDSNESNSTEEATDNKEN